MSHDKQVGMAQQLIFCMWRVNKLLGLLHLNQMTEEVAKPPAANVIEQFLGKNNQFNTL